MVRHFEDHLVLLYLGFYNNTKLGKELAIFFSVAGYRSILKGQISRLKKSDCASLVAFKNTLFYKYKCGHMTGFRLTLHKVKKMT